MKLSENTYLHQIEELKNENARLRQEVEKLNARQVNSKGRESKDRSIKKYINMLNFLSCTANRMLGPLSLPELFGFVSDQIYSVADGAVICFSEFDAVNQKAIVRELRCTNEEREKLLKILGRPEGITFDFPDDLKNRIIPGGLDFLEGGFRELVFSQLPESLCSEIERELNIKSVFAMTCSVENDILGTVAVLAHESNHILPNKELIESVVNQAALVLKRKQSETQIKELLELSERRSEEAKMRATEIEAILSCIPGGILVYDNQGHIVRSNSTADDILKYPENEKKINISEQVNRHYSIWTEDGHQLKTEELPAYRAAIKAETTANKTLRIQGNGQSRWLVFNAAPLIVSEKHSGGVISMLDITSRKLMEEALRESEQRLQVMFDNSAIGITEVDQNDRFIAVNNYMCKILGYSREELLGKAVFDITAPGDLPYSLEMNVKLHRGELDTFDYEKQYIKHDHSLIWVHVSVSAVHDLQGRHIRTVRIVEDISERKKIEQSLIDSEEMFSSMFQATPIGISLATFPNGAIYNVNQAWLDLTGYNQKEEVLGKTSTELGLIYNTEERDEIMNTFKQQGFVRNAEIIFLTKTGAKRVVSVNIDVIHLRGQRYLLSTNEDITEKKMNEQEIKQKNEELTRFIYTVSHDLKSPLVTIKSFTSYLKEDIENQDKAAQDKDIGYIQNAADKMGKLLDELLSLSRIGKKEEPKTEVTLQAVAQAATDLVAGRIADKNAKINFVGPPVMLYGHSQRLIQLYQNLIDNAVKFMGNQPDPIIEIGSFVDSNKNIVILFIKDNGSGIDPKYHHKLFGLFEKLDASTEGTGIGLALIKRIVEVHGGSIWFTSEGANKGTTFCFTLEGSRVLKS